MGDKDSEQAIDGDPSGPDEERVFTDRELADDDADRAAQAPRLHPVQKKPPQPAGALLAMATAGERSS